MRTKQRPSLPTRSPLAVRPEVPRLDPFRLGLEIEIRRCRRSDLPALEWFGLFTQDREIIHNTFNAQTRGESIMLVADVNGVASGQIWIDLTRRDLDSTGVIWAAHVSPCLQNVGIGTRLIRASERILCDQGFKRAELSVDRTNTAARRLYERLGYRLIRTRPVKGGEVTEERVPILVPGEQWLLRKDLR